MNDFFCISLPLQLLQPFYNLRDEAAVDIWRILSEMKVQTCKMHSKKKKKLAVVHDFTRDVSTKPQLSNHQRITSRFMDNNLTSIVTIYKVFP